MSESHDPKTRPKMIIPPDTMKQRVSVSGSGAIDLAPVVRAEQALKQLSVAFEGWLKDEVTILSAARDNVHKHGLTSDTQEKLYLAAHDLKGQAETYGYPLISRVCATLCTLLDAATQPHLIPLEIIDHHVNSVRNMMAQKIKSETHPQGLAVSDRLHEVVAEFADHENKKRAQPPLEQEL